MRRFLVSLLILALCYGTPQAIADSCDDTVDEHNEAVQDAESWFEDALQGEFGVSTWSALPFGEDNFCKRIVPIYREQLSKAEEILSLRQAAEGVCRNLRSVGNGRPAEEKISIIQENIRLCEEDSPEDGMHADGGGEGEEEFKAAQQQTEQQQQAAVSAAPPPQNSTSRYGRSANCSDITGTGGSSAADCPEPGKREFAAVPQEKAARLAPSPQKDATPPSAKPGVVDQLTGLAGSIVDALGLSRSGQVPRSSTGAMSDPPKKKDDDEEAKLPDPYRVNPPQLPEKGRRCFPYFAQMMRGMEQNAALCMRDTVLMESLKKITGNEEVSEEDIVVTRETAPSLYARFEPQDKRWIRDGDRYKPDCRLPLQVASQRDAFLECARAYLCGARAAQCGLRRAKHSDRDCIPISEACLAEHPVPQYMAQNPSPPAYQPPNWQQAQPKGMPPSKSTITGPSGPGGGGGSGGVIPAR